PVWFVQNVEMVGSSDLEIMALDNLNTKQTAIVHSDFEALLSAKVFAQDSTASIALRSYQPNHLIYESSSEEDRLAVFSEIYYPFGWNAYIDGKQVKHLRANYVLRALTIPKGDHTVEFKFEPKVVRLGSTIALGSSIGFLLILLGIVYFRIRKQNL
ncbi:MAG: YfhO family protein, partial [Flavobacteriaceae bacterium]|nr:YfhO family protein [Flavobacteriaceae bacterium]